jgi:hypothetical protein
MKKNILFLVLVALLLIFSCNNDSDSDSENLEKRYVEPAARGAYITQPNSRNVDSEYEEVELENGETIEVLKITHNSYEDFLNTYYAVINPGETFFAYEDADSLPSSISNQYARYLEIIDRLGDEEEVVFSNHGHLGYAWSLGQFIQLCAQRVLFTDINNKNNKVYFEFEDERLNPILDYDERYLIALENSDIWTSGGNPPNKTILKNEIIKYQNGFVIKSEIAEVDKDFYNRGGHPYPKMKIVEFRVILSNQSVE